MNLVPSVPSFCTRTKFRLKNRVTTVHLLQFKTNFFIHIYAFEGEIYCKLKNIHLKEHQINEHQPPLYKQRFFDSFILV